jgi:hypothetical protein
MGVMIWEAFFSFNDKTPFRMVISSSLKGSVPSRWNCKKVFNSAFRKLRNAKEGEWIDMDRIRVRYRKFRVKRTWNGHSRVTLISSQSPIEELGNGPSDRGYQIRIRCQHQSHMKMGRMNGELQIRRSVGADSDSPMRYIKASTKGAQAPPI